MSVLRDESTFWCTVRLGRGETPTAGCVPAGRQAPLAAVATRFSAHILVAEDSAVNQEVIRDLLEHFGCCVRIVASGTTAVDAVLSEPFDLVFMDCHMPEMDGFQATRLIRTREALRTGGSEGATHHDRRLPIIALTADFIEGTREKCLAVGMDDYMPKPIKVDALHGVLLAHLPKRCHTPVNVGAETNTAPPPGPPDDSAIDERALADLCALEAQGATGLLAKAIDLYLRDGASHIHRIHAAVAAGDAGAIRERAHSLKSASAILGAMTVARLCKELEHMGASGTVEVAASAALQLAEEFEKARAVLLRARDKEKP